MLDVMKAFMLVEHGAGAIAFPEDGQAGYSRVLNAERGPQRTRDGWVNILPYSKAAYEALFTAGGRPELIDDRLRGRGMTDNAESLYHDLRQILPQRTTSEWVAFCKEHDIPIGLIANLDDIVGELPLEQHTAAGDYRFIPPPIRYMQMADKAHIEAPLVGQNSEAVLLDAGLTEHEVQALADKGVVRLGGKVAA